MREYKDINAMSLNAASLGGKRLGNMNGNIPTLCSFPNHTQIIELGYVSQDKLYSVPDYLKGICDWVNATYGDASTFVGSLRPNSSGTGIIHKNLSGWINGIFVGNKEIYHFGYANNEWYCYKLTLTQNLTNMQVTDLQTQMGGGEKEICRWGFTRDRHGERSAA